jgi:CPA1 family monovalent cation:H+ antiporter
MALFEITIALLIIGALLAALARKLQAPYPAFLAVAGAVLASIPGTPTLTLSPELVLTLFVAPSLLDAAYDASPRDLRDNWLPIAGSAVVAVVLTVAAVAWAARWLRPDIPWAVAVVLGAIVAPPDAAAATAVLRALRPPHRVMVILEGESLFNDATALLIYRVALAVALGSWSGWIETPILALSLVGGAVLGGVLGRVWPPMIERIEDAPTSVIVQFVSTFALWILASRLGLSPILTLLCFAMGLARRSQMNARLRIQSYAVWDVTIFVLNVLAFILAGLQLRPILAGLGGLDWQEYATFGAFVLAVCVLVRIAWVMSYNTVVRWKIRRFGTQLRRPMTLPTVGTGLVISWCGMRGVVTLATALALPEEFPFRGLILFAAFAVVLGTLVVQGITLRPLMGLLCLPDDDQVGREVRHARQRAAEAAIAALAQEASGPAILLRQEYDARLAGDAEPPQATQLLRRHRILALRTERRVIVELRAAGEIGDDAYHTIEEELDWAEMYVQRTLAQG